MKIFFRLDRKEKTDIFCWTYFQETFKFHHYCKTFSWPGNIFLTFQPKKRRKKKSRQRGFYVSYLLETKMSPFKNHFNSTFSLRDHSLSHLVIVLVDLFRWWRWWRRRRLISNIFLDVLSLLVFLLFLTIWWLCPMHWQQLNGW